MYINASVVTLHHYIHMYCIFVCTVSYCIEAPYYIFQNTDRTRVVNELFIIWLIDPLFGKKI